MIKVKTLKKLLDELPDDAEINAYEGEDTGLSIEYKGNYAWIRATSSQAEELYISGFKGLLLKANNGNKEI